MNGYKNCYYDFKKNKIYLKEQGKVGWSEHDYMPWCYITDETGEGAYKDIYKKSLKRHACKDIKEVGKYKDTIARFKESGITVAELDLTPVVKFMHERYDKEEISVDINDWNICFFDIEVAGSSKYYDEQLIDIRLPNDPKSNETVELYKFDTQYRHKNRYEVFDIEQHCWVKFADSCFVSYEFPAPEKAEWPMNLITCYSSRTKQTYTWGLKPYFGEIKELPNYIACKNEWDLFNRWTSWFKHQDFDIITGWNSESYDIPYIINRCRKLRDLNPENKAILERRLSPFNKDPEAEEKRDRKLEDVDLGTKFNIPGLYSIDYMEVYKTFGNHPPMPSYSLNYVSNFELKDTKLEYSGSINETYKYEWDRFAQYNRKDVLLPVRIEEKNKLFPLLIEYAFNCIVTLDRVSNKVPTTTGYILKFLHNKGQVLNDKKKSHDDWWAKEGCYKIKLPDGSTYYQNTEWENDNKEFKKFLLLNRIHHSENPDIEIENSRADISEFWKPKTIKGVRRTTAQLFTAAYDEFKLWPHPFPKFQTKAGYCYDFPGRYDDCMSFDITSSYPHHIMMFNLSPEVKVIHPSAADVLSGKVILTDVNEVGFLRTDDAILPSIVKQVFGERKIWKDKEEAAIDAGDMELAALCHNRQMTKKLIINSVYGVSLAPTFHLYDPDVARCICRCARVTLRDWLSRYGNAYYTSTKMIKDIEKYYGITLKNKTPLQLKNRESAIVHNDTDSAYICIHEIRERLIEEGIYSNRKTKPLLHPVDGMTDADLAEMHRKNHEIMMYNKSVADEYRDFFKHAENMFQDFFNEVLDRRAKKFNVNQLIKFNRENIFTNMFCFAKKLYIGSVVDSEKALFPLESIDLEALSPEEIAELPKSMIKHPEGPKHKIMGVPIKKSTMPDFCKVASEKLAFDICAGMSKDKADEFIRNTYDEYRHSDINVISAVIGISNYKKYIPFPIDYYVKNGLEFDKGDNTAVIFGAKAALTYNYVVAKKRFKLNPINNNTKMKYIYVKPNNEFKYREVGKPGIKPIEFIAFLDAWPAEFNDLFEIDHETMFRKSFCALFEAMYTINGWLKKGKSLELEKSELESFFC